MRVPYVTVDVFTDRRFGGNPLAVIPDARAVPDELLLPIAREFNYSETTFVYPPDDDRHTRRVRIFTPGGELPFAGHPTVGTAHVLAATGAIALDGDETHIVLEEKVGPVPVTIRARGGVPTFAQLSVASMPEERDTGIEPAALAAALGLDAGDLLDGAMAPRAVSCGVPFVIAPLRDRDAVRRARLGRDAWERTLEGKWADMVLVFAHGGERPGSDLRARMFAPGIGVPEDPATGGAAVALGGYLAARSGADATLRWVVEQGFEMGRPSILHVEADRVGGETVAVRVGGETVFVCAGEMEL